MDEHQQALVHQHLQHQQNNKPCEMNTQHNHEQNGDATPPRVFIDHHNSSGIRSYGLNVSSAPIVIQTWRNFVQQPMANMYPHISKGQQLAVDLSLQGQASSQATEVRRSSLPSPDNAYEDNTTHVKSMPIRKANVQDDNLAGFVKREVHFFTHAISIARTKMCEFTRHICMEEAIQDINHCTTVEVSPILTRAEGHLWKYLSNGYDGGCIPDKVAQDAVRMMKYITWRFSELKQMSEWPMSPQHTVPNWIFHWSANEIVPTRNNGTDPSVLERAVNEENENNLVVLAFLYTSIEIRLVAHSTCQSMMMQNMLGIMHAILPNLTSSNREAIAGAAIFRMEFLLEEEIVLMFKAASSEEHELEMQNIVGIGTQSRSDSTDG